MVKIHKPILFFQELESLCEKTQKDPLTCSNTVLSCAHIVEVGVKQLAWKRKTKQCVNNHEREDVDKLHPDRDREDVVVL